MKRYKRKFKEAPEKQTNIIYYSRNSIKVQSLFGLTKEFNTGLDLMKFFRSNEDLEEVFYKEIQIIEKEINDINKILYNFSLSKISYLQGLLQKWEERNEEI